MEKACSIMVSKVKSQSMAGRGDFSKMWFFFPQGILTFFYACFYAGGKMLIFLDVIFFCFARVCFKKQQKKRCDILRLSESMGSKLSFAVSNVFICGLVVSMCFSEKSLFTIIKIVKNKLIEYKKLFCG